VITDFTIVSQGDSCLLVVFEEKIDRVINDRCIQIAKSLEDDDEVGEAVPGYHTVAVYFDPLHVDRRSLVRRLERRASGPIVLAQPRVEVFSLFEIPVRYGGERGPDLAAVADIGRCSEEEVVRLHTAVEYRVYMLGFLPGFAYLSSVDRRIAVPRLDAPRLRVQAGSVGIAGIQTAIYPCDTPGGWRIIGRTDIKPFDIVRPQPFLFRPGMRVKFVAA
jgi:KipI family sensor histidine kinase inhibitor